jgi:ribose transport system permease protein
MTTKNNLSVSTDQEPLTIEKPETKAGTPGEIVKALFRWEASGVLVALILLCAILAVASPNFLTAFNLTVVIREASFVGLVALGQTLVLLLGGIDLSVGAAAGLSAIVGCLFLKSLGIPPWLVIPATAVFGLCIGSISGFFISVLKLNPFIVTLAMWEIFAGMTLVITKGYPIRPLGPAFTVYGQGEIFGIPGPVLLFLVAAAVLVWVLAKTRFGRNLYALGGNRDAAVLVGIPVLRVELFVYALAGMFAALAGIMYASRMDAGQPSVGEGWLMKAITAAILGGTSLKGGQGTILGTVFGTLLTAVLANGLSLMNVSAYWARVVVGAIVLIAILGDLLRHRGKR